MAKINPNINTKNSDQKQISPLALGELVLKGDRIALSKAITLVESESQKDESFASDLITFLLTKSPSSFRIGISGSPGAGKSTLIDALGIYLVESGMKPAVLAIDPSSSRSKGSILGDKTRMERLAKSEKAFIRPSPAGKTLGGVARKTRETILLLEAAGFDPILVETVGVGQSETMVKSMTDLFLLLIAPGAGDEIQGIKRGIIEMADIIAVNKMDGQLKKQAIETLLHYQSALELVSSEKGWPKKALGISALQTDGLQQLWQLIHDYQEYMHSSGHFESNRAAQNIKWFENHIRAFIFDKLMSEPKIEKNFLALRTQVQNGKLSPFGAAQNFFQSLNITDEL